MKRPIALTIAVAVLVGLAIGFLCWHFARPDFAALALWAEQQGLSPGSHQRIALPDELAAWSQDGTTNIVVEPSGRVIMLIKTTIGWKGNYSGYVISNRPLTDSDFSRDYNGRTQIAVPGLDVTDPLVSYRHSDTVWHVFFDLG